MDTNRQQATIEVRGTCCQCDNALAAGGHEHCQLAARRALERLTLVFRAAKTFTGRPPAGSEWRKEVTNDEYHALHLAVVNARTIGNLDV